ncbi:DEAD/DEAH box helicase [Alteraurantiacibacter aestuarii]|uniref:DEAD-box ATP-dependent RNA helicase RhpA n=1 Tax=Alteraurantiacibacter aestuarii TaxID=650004 RepID=A0A844ZL33_9SPHN|nr:DEAD/DEAH box helicase [Alteraurantiacibacter aestuarii]MXO87720.1 DEAD/DEAH box helicase [Alteraurantiacibacter aestuarii]
MKFADLGLSDELLKAVEDAGYTEPTPIQAEAIPQVQMMRDLIAIAQTGTGKTASFVLPMIDILANGRRRARMPRSLILEPTRELAMQVAENFEKYGKNHNLNMALLIGGVQMGTQLKELDEGVDVLIATPGRLMDLFERGKILLTGCDLLVIDEADRMLDMGFIPDIEFICEKLPAQRQTLLFSATMPPPIKKLADRFLTNPKSIEVARAATANVNIAQFKVEISPRKKKQALKYLLEVDNVSTAIIFANRKTTVRELNKELRKAGFRSGEIHGDMDQSSRIAELDLFKSGEVNILVASDVAARGLDIKGVSHVFNYDTPWHPDDYVHRIGRTGRAGAKGRAITLVTPEDAEALANVEKLTGIKVPPFDWSATSPQRDEGRQEGVKEAEIEAKAKAAKDSGRDSGRDSARDSGRDSERDEKPRRSRRKKADEPRAEAAPREEEAAQDEPRARQARPERAREDKPREAAPREAAPREEKPRAEKPARKPRKSADEGEKGDAGEWNGPKPSFLNFGFD